ncbi:MAG: hypothetical protein JNK53_07855 [Phycisphaerae bacterium]|nr:hypothetical protein [Phycisphaerae bacterium]
MDARQLRKALSELNGQRDVRVEFVGAHTCTVRCAFLVPEEDDGQVKISDGQRIVLIDAERVAWIEIGTHTEISPARAGSTTR